MAFSVDDLKANLDFGGARPTLFNVQITLPASISNTAAERKLTFTCSAAEIPPSSIGVMRVPYFGRLIPYAGDRAQFQPWTVTVINDEDFIVREAFENWHNYMNARRRNVRLADTDATSLYKGTALVKQYARTGADNVLRTYTFDGIWPSNISGIQLDWGAIDQFEQFTVTFEYTSYDIQGPTVTAGNIG